MLSTETLFDNLRNQRTTEDGRACVEIARREYESGGEEASKEARQWVKLGAELDNKDLARQLADLQEKFGLKTKGRGAANRMRDRKRAAGGNVVPIREDGI